MPESVNMPEPAMKANKPMRQIISRVFLIGAALLLLFYGLLHKSLILITENEASQRRLAIVAPHYFDYYRQGGRGEQPINPILTTYDSYQALPIPMQRRLAPDWVGLQAYHFEDESEFAVFAQKILTPDGATIVYAIENMDVVEFADDAFVLIEVVLFVAGLILFLIAAGFISKTAQRIAAPFQTLANQLENEPLTDFSELEVQGHTSRELEQTRRAINDYRQRISQSIEREQSFTRYVSHELRTPMTVIKGSLSILRRQDIDVVNKQRHRIEQALADMEQLTQTFLLLARDDELVQDELVLDSTYFDEQVKDLEHLLSANECQLTRHITPAVKLPAHPVLFTALLKNLLINAINNTEGGEVTIQLTPEQLRISDNGIGLEQSPRGYEGFGIGLVLVKDICDKYQWDFSLAENPERGCLATVTFTADSGSVPIP